MKRYTIILFLALLCEGCDCTVSSQYHVKLNNSSKAQVVINQVESIVEEAAAKHRLKIDPISSGIIAQSAERAYRIGEESCHVAINIAENIIVIDFWLFHPGFPCSGRHSRFKSTLESRLKSFFCNYYIEVTNPNSKLYFPLEKSQYSTRR